MAIFRKNIWLLFFLFLVLSFLFLVVLSTFRWQSLTTHYELSQQGLVRQWFSGYSSLLEQQEAIITLIGEDILQYRQTGEGDPQARLDELMNLNPALFSGFALVSPQGDLLELTSNLGSDTLPQLMQLPQTRETFSYALNTKRMVIGRTYFAPRLVVPARKAIRNKDGTLSVS